MNPDSSASDRKNVPIDSFVEPSSEQMADLHRKVVAELKLSPADKEAARAAALEIVRAARQPGKDAEAAISSAKRAASKHIDKSSG